MNRDPLSREVIEEATRQLIASPGFSEKLAWWLVQAHAAERWFQFEWAHCLSRVLGDEDCFVACEFKRTDVVVADRAAWLAGKSEGLIRAGLELKWYGNWWYSAKQSDDLQKDIDKAKAYPFPAAALAFLLLGKPERSEREYAWIEDQVEKGAGVETLDELVRTHREKVHGLDLAYDFGFPLKTPTGFQNMGLHVLAFRNAA